MVCVSYDGFDETEDMVFPNMITETKKIEKYIQKKFGGHICAAYGCSLGGSFVGLLVQHRKIHIDHGILGSSDLDQSSSLMARLKTAVVAPMLVGLLRKDSIPRFVKKWLARQPEEERNYYQKMMEMFRMGTARMAFVKKQSICNQFYSDLVTPLEDNISVSSTVVHCLYAVKMGGKYEGRYRKHFRAPDIRRYNLCKEFWFCCFAVFFDFVHIESY